MAGRESAAGVTILFPDDLKEYIDRHREGSYLLLDVRQPEEYEDNHLPGSKSVPLPMLASSLAELDPQKDTIVYCSVGGRSLMAARFLAARGFSRTFQLEGGIEAWEERTASGPSELYLQFVRGDESAEEGARIALGMESGLEQFHRKAFEKSDSPLVRGLLEKLVKAEESHIEKLRSLLEKLGSTADSAVLAGKMEGGLDVDDFLRRNESFLQSPHGCLELAMMIEVQALDLYLQMAQSCSDNGVREVFFGLADEEKSHLNSLGELLGKEFAGPEPAKN